MPRFGRYVIACLSVLAPLGVANAYNSEEHKIIVDWGASMVHAPCASLPAPTGFPVMTWAAWQQLYKDAKFKAVGFATNNAGDYSSDTRQVQDNSYWTGFAQIYGNKNVWIPPTASLRETTIAVGSVASGAPSAFTIGELVSIYGDYRRTVNCVGANCYLTDAETPTLTFNRGTDCFATIPPCGWRPNPISMVSYLRYIGSGLWPPYGECGNASGNTANDNEYYDAGWWGDEMLRIAGTNDWHFSSAGVAWYVGMHRLALLEVNAARTDPAHWNHALHDEACALHSLTDLFAFGHVVTNRDRTSYGIMVADGLTGSTTYQWMENVIHMGGGTRDGEGRVRLDSSLPTIVDVASVRNDFLASYVPLSWSSYAVQEKDFHDAYNNTGATVRNLKGDQFTIYGDGLLRQTSASSVAVMVEAVRASLQSLFDACTRLGAGATVAQIGSAGDPYFAALKSIPVFIEGDPPFTFKHQSHCPTDPLNVLPAQNSGNNFNGQWTLFAQFADQVAGTHVVPADISGCTMAYEDGAVELPTPGNPNPCSSFPALGAPPPVTPTSVSLAQSRPNPATANTTIEYTLPVESSVKLEIFDARGRRIVVLDEGTRSATTHRLVWNGADGDGHPQRAGFYYYRLTVNGHTQEKNLVLLR